MGIKIKNILNLFICLMAFFTLILYCAHLLFVAANILFLDIENHKTWNFNCLFIIWYFY
ncbi:hypothetical protein D3C86_947770 [compost metagenome]